MAEAPVRDEEAPAEADGAPSGMPRRSVLLGGLAALLLAPVAWLSNAGFRRWGPWWIRWRLRYLDLSAVDLDAYVEEYGHHLGWGPRPDLGRDLVTRLLLSTDFFHEGADEGRPLRYRGFYYPEILPCANPFAQAPPGEEE